MWVFLPLEAIWRSCLAFSMSLYWEKPSLGTQSVSPQPWTGENKGLTLQTITLSCGFPIWPKKLYSRPSHQLLMTSSTLKCQVLMFTALPLGGTITLMRSTGWSPASQDLWHLSGIISIQLELPHIKHAEVKLHILLTFYSPGFRAELMDPSETRQLANRYWASNTQGPGTKRVTEKDWT